MSFFQDGQQLSCVNCAAVFHSVLDAAEHTITCKVPILKDKESKEMEITQENNGETTYEVVEAQEPSMPMVTAESPKPQSGFQRKEISLEQSAAESPYFSSNEKARWTRGVIANLLTLMKAHVNDLGRARARGGSRAAAPVWIEICEAMQEKVGPWVTRAKIMVKWQTLVDKSKKYDEETENRKARGLPPTLAPDFHTIIKEIDKGIKTAMVTNLLEDDDDEEEEDDIGDKTGDTSSSSKAAQEDFEQGQPRMGEEGKGMDDDSSPEWNPEEDDDEDSDISESSKPIKKEFKNKLVKASPNKGAAPIAIEADGVTLSRDTTIKVFNCLEVDCRTVADVAKEFGMSVAVLDTLQKNRGAVLAGCHECQMCGLILANKEQGNSHELNCAIKNKSMNTGRSIARDYSFHWYPITVRHLVRLVINGEIDKPNWPSITRELSVHQEGLSIERCSQKWRNITTLCRAYKEAQEEAKKKNKVVTKQQPEFYKQIIPHLKELPIRMPIPARGGTYQRKINNMNNYEDADDPPSKRIKTEPGASGVSHDVVKKQQDHITSLEKKLDNVVRLLKEVSDENKRMSVEVKKKDFDSRKQNLDTQSKTFQSSVGLKLDQMARLHHQMHDENIQHQQTIIGMFERHHQENQMMMRTLTGEISKWRTGDNEQSSSGDIWSEQGSGRKRKLGVVSMTNVPASESSNSRNKRVKSQEDDNVNVTEKVSKIIDDTTDKSNTMSESSTSDNKVLSTHGGNDKNETEKVSENNDATNKSDKSTNEDKANPDTPSKSDSEGKDTSDSPSKSTNEDKDNSNLLVKVTVKSPKKNLEKDLEQIDPSESLEKKIEEILNEESSSPSRKDSDKIEDMDTGAPVPVSPRKSTRTPIIF